MPYKYANWKSHVGVSHGGDSDVMKFYCTTSAVAYGRHWQNFEPRTGTHIGSGYVSNVRPQIFYKSRLDEVDNPGFGRQLWDNYESVTKKSFQPYQHSDGTDHLPNSTLHKLSGYTQTKSLHNPTEYEVSEVAIDKRIRSAPTDIRAKAVPYLHKIQGHDPIEEENNQYGPGYMTTETGERFKGLQPDSSFPKRRLKNTKQETGFTHGVNEEPITFHPNYAYRNLYPASLTPRPTGVSLTTTDFRPLKYPNGLEPLPKISCGANRNSGFTSSAKSPFLPVKYEDGQPKQDQIGVGTWPSEPSRAAMLGRQTVGNKEPTGYINNGDCYVQTHDHPGRFLTHYNTEFVDRIEGLNREGYMWDGVLPQQANGFTRSTELHKKPDLDTSETLGHLDSYVARSIKARDVHYDDHTYDHKLCKGDDAVLPA